MKKFILQKAKLLSLGLIFVSLFACTSDEDYLYCDNITIEIVNASHDVIYYSWVDYICDNPLYPGQSTIRRVKGNEINLNHPDGQLFDYRFGTPGDSRYTMDIAIDECHKVIYIE